MKTWQLVTRLATFTSTAFAIGQQPTIAFEQSPGVLNLASRNKSVRIIIDDGEWPAVKRAANDLALDFGCVTGLNASVHSIQTLKNGSSISNTLNQNNSTPFTHGGVILVGTLGRSPIVDQLARNGKLQTEVIVGQWESFSSMIIEAPFPGVSNALVIAGVSYTSVINRLPPDHANKCEQGAIGEALYTAYMISQSK
jgi:hypothetical protein